jgi:hypothetical protein
VWKSDITLVLHWLASDRGLTVLDLISWLLLASGAIGIALGPKRREKLSQAIDRFCGHFAPARIPQLAWQATLGLVGRSAYLMFGVAAAVTLVFNLFQLYRALVLSGLPLTPDVDGLLGFLLKTQHDPYFVWAVKVFAAVFGIPLFFTGGTVGIWLIRKNSASAQFEKWTDGAAKYILDFQIKHDLLTKILVAIIGTVALLAFATGTLVAWLLLAVTFKVFQTVLRGLAVFATRAKLQQIVAAIGIVLKVGIYAAKLVR